MPWPVVALVVYIDTEISQQAALKQGLRSPVRIYLSPTHLRLRESSLTSQWQGERRLERTVRWRRGRDGTVGKRVMDHMHVRRPSLTYLGHPRRASIKLSFAHEYDVF